MKRLWKTLLCATIASLSVGASASTLRIVTPVEGGVATVSAGIDCGAGQVCDVNISDVFFDETFVAEPAHGWQFAGWKTIQGGLCVAETENCRVDASELEDPSILDDPGVIQHLEPEFVVDRTTSGIALADERTVSQFGSTVELDFYRNSEYSCGLSGNYTFMVVNPINSDENTEAPLWIYLHGGGSGFFDENGDYHAVNNQTEDTWNHEETFDDLVSTQLQGRIVDSGQLQDITLTRRLQEGYRLVLVSMCDHDQYSGLGTPYPNNPNPGAEVNGIQATMSAVEYTVGNYPTTDVFAHGTSAGSPGAYNLAMSFAAEGIHLSGVVADSIISPRVVELFWTFPGEGNRQPGWTVEGFAEKIGFYGDLARPLDPESRIAAGFDDVPLLFVGGAEDSFCMAYLSPIPEADALGLNNCEWAAQGLIDTIAAQPNSLHQVANLPGLGHVPTNRETVANDVVDTFISEILASNPPAPFADTDGDGVLDSVDNCRAVANADQAPSTVNPECGAACVTMVCGPATCSNP